MGSVFSVGNTKSDQSEWNQVSTNETSKRQKMWCTFDEESARLIPNLPDELSLQIIARLPRICYFNVRLVSRKWKAAVTSSELYKVRKDLGTTEEWLYLLIKVGDNKQQWHAVDPRSRMWQRLPIMPKVADEEESRKSSSKIWMWNMVESIRITEVIRSFLGQKDAFDEMPFSGCAIGAVDGSLYVLGGFSKASTMRCVWRFDPIENMWSKATPMSTGRAYCKTGILNNKLYVVGGVSQGQAGLNPLQSAEVFDPSSDTWSPVPSMPFSKAQVLPTVFWADMLKPIATGLTSYMGKLCVPQSLYSWPFFVDVGGEIYDPETNSWIEMPTGMGEGWPARQAGSKLSVVVDGELYAFDLPILQIVEGSRYMIKEKMLGKMQLEKSQYMIQLIPNLHIYLLVSMESFMSLQKMQIMMLLCCKLIFTAVGILHHQPQLVPFMHCQKPGQNRIRWFGR